MTKRYPLFTQALAAVFVTAIAVAIRFALDPLLGTMQPFAPGFVAVAFVGWFFGWQGAVLTAVLTYLAGNYFFVPPRLSWTFRGASDVASVITNLTSSLIITAITHAAREARLALEQANRELAVASGQKDRFVALVSHELRGPLSALANALTVLNRADAAPEQRAQMLALAGRQTAQMKELVDDLLDLSRMERGELRLTRKPHDVALCVRDAVERTAAAFASRQQTVSVTAPECFAEVDPLRITQVLANVLDNAAKYCPEGTHVSVRLRPGDPLVIEIEDDGAGIPDRLLPHLFRFEKSADLRSTDKGGLGLGLPLSHKLVELHGGSLEVTNVTGSGARFVMRLPGTLVVSRTSSAAIGR